MTESYLLLFRGTEWDRGLSPEETRQALDPFNAWFDDLHQRNLFQGGHPLFSGGHTVTGRGVLDGPFAETKEAVGGYIIVQVASYDEAVEIAHGWPGLPYGGSVEVRHVAPECQVSARAREFAQAAV